MTERILGHGCFSIHDGFLAPLQALVMYVALVQETEKYLKTQLTYAHGWPARLDADAPVMCPFSKPMPDDELWEIVRRWLDVG
jgi:hypothetical protein